ncbi:MAG: hypothetical protein NC086_05080 [Alistipes sp.]|nr:hypothetical protein [Alistipes sp.]
MKTIHVKPVEDIEIRLKDKNYICSFNMLTMAYLQDEIVKIKGKISEVSPAHTAALVLYAGIKTNEPDFTVEEANALALQMGPAHYEDIMAAFNEAVFASMNKEQDMTAKNLIAQYWENVKKSISE